MTTSEQQFAGFWIVSNYSCNNRCNFCYTEAQGFPSEKLSLENQKGIIDSMTELGAKKCTLIGGEPTLHPNIVDVIEYGSQHGLKMKVVTNGRKYANEDFLQRMIDAGMSFTAISVHGSSKEEHAGNTGVERSFDETLAGIKNCIKLNVPFVTLTTVNASNKDRVCDMARFLHNLGVKSIVYNLASPIEGDVVNDKILSPAELARIIQGSYKVLKSEGIQAHFYATVPLCLFDRDLLTSMIDESYLIPLSGGAMSECNIYDGSGIAFDPTGNILACTHQVNSPIEAILDDQQKIKPREQVRDILLRVRGTIGPENWKYPSEDCDACEMRMKCIGGCPLFWRYFNPGDYIDKSAISSPL
ncbi:MAG: radical SAM domain heme biosynthesis protein [Candidatus Peregrinibacteria bacterium GW2011_GWC2_39_14]|nr:MAG: Radical SAM domain heme biosynthesis protein [Candidatus Peregrinibacteria bacterium GW2011_GWA2_38_36]KKR06704.1 MAG: radical SAM domain heme biosynthesis protein [Candidatus Peregrinibacteria bacterium GW2011_GWC2_39_14]